MTPEVTTALVAAAGLIATTAASALGLYFTSRARTAPMQQLLYERQLELVTRMLNLVGRVKLYGPILLDAETAEFHATAREDLRRTLRSLSRASDSAAALLPVDLYVAFIDVTRHITDFCVALDGGKDTSWFPAALAGHGAKAALLARTYLGVDHLSDVNAGLFARRKHLESVTSLDPALIARAAKPEHP